MTSVVEPVDFLDPRVVELRRQMSAEMSALYGRPRHTAAAEDIDPASVILTLLATDDGVPVATVSLRRLRDLVEIKRMYLLPAARGTGLASVLLARVEASAAQIGGSVVLHTGLRQVAAIALYRRSGYVPIEVFAPYDRMPESVCFRKELSLGEGESPRVEADPPQV